MDETENFVVEDSCRTQGSDGDDNDEMMFPKRNVVQKNGTNELGIEDEYGVSTSDKVAYEQSSSPEHSALATDSYGEVAVEKTCSNSGINENQSFGIDEFDSTSRNVQESQYSDGSSAEKKHSSPEISQNKVGKTTQDNSETTEARGVYNVGKPHLQGPKHYVPPGWVYHGDSDGYRYYIGCAGEMYSVDRDGYWYMQDSGGNFIAYNGYQYNRGAHSSLFPRDSQGRFTLPTNARGEKAFPVDMNNMPIFPIDTTTHLPTFPVDENGQPVFPTGTLGRPIVPVDTNGLAIFPRDANGRFIFPSGPNGKPTAPVNIYGVPVMPIDEQGKPVVPYDASGTPLIHLASDGITPLTEEEYQYSLQWNDYYSRYYKNTTEQKVSSSNHSTTQLTSADDTYEQKAKNMKMLKKVRPEDIDLPPCVPPPPPIQPSPLVSDGSALSSEVEKKATFDPALKAKTKKMIEMQLKFSRKKLHDAVNSSVAAVPSSETINTSLEYASLPRQPSDSPEDIDKVESPKERPPPPPMHAPSPDPPAAEHDNIKVKESRNMTLDGAQKSLDSQIVRNSSGDLGTKGQIAVMQTESIPIILSISESAVKTPSNITRNFGSEKLYSNLCKNLESEFQTNIQAFENETTTKLDGCISGSKDEEVISGKRPEPILTDDTVKLDTVSKKQLQEDIDEKKIATKVRSPVRNICDSKTENQMLQRRGDKNESVLAAHEKRFGKKIRHHDWSKDRRKRRSESRQRRSRSRSVYRDSHRRSRSRGMKHESRTRSRTPRDYYHRGRYHSRSRDQFQRQESSYCDRHSYRRYWTPDTEEKYVHRKRHSSSRDGSSRRERSENEDITPTADKSSRSHSYERSISRTESQVVSRHSSVARSISQCRTTDIRNLSSSRHNSPECGNLQILERESEKSPLQSTETLRSIDYTTDIHKSAHNSTSSYSENRNSVKGLELKTEKSRKRKKSREKHKKGKKSRHKKKDKRKPSSLFSAESDDEKYKASNALLSQPANGEEKTVSIRKNVPNDCENDRIRKKKEKKKKKERRSDTKRASRETLEEGEIITEKDISPKERKKVVSYATSESEGENNKSESPADQLVESCNIKGVPPATMLSMDSKVTENPFGANFNDANTFRSSVLSFDFVDEVSKVSPGITNISKMEKDTKLNYESINSKRETKITVDLGDDRASDKHDSANDFSEITAREAEKLKADNITEAMNKLKELRGYVKSKVTVSNSATGMEVTKQFNKGNDNDPAFVGYSLADVPLPKGIQEAAVGTERVEQTVTARVRTHEACTSAKINSMDRDVKRKKEMLKRKWEEDEEDELSRLRYEALRSKTRRLMNDLRAERRRLKRERLRTTLAMRRARERSVDASVDEILLADTSDTSETDDSEDYSPSHKKKLLKRKRYSGREAVVVQSNQSKICGLKESSNNEGDMKQQQNACTSDSKKQLEANAPDNLILELQQRIGGSNEGALELLEQLKKCLIAGAVSSNIHLNPEVIRKNA